MSLIQIGQPLYEWKTRNGLIFVTQSGQLINQNAIKKTVTSVNIYNKLSYTFEFNQIQCKHLDISPCENYLAYSYEIDNTIFVAISDAPGGGDRTINLSSRISPNSQIFQLFWIRNNLEEHLLLLVTNNSIELFSLGVDMTTRTLKRISVTCIYCWGNHIANYVLLLNNNTGSSVILQPYRITDKIIEKLDVLEIEIPGTELIQEDEIELILIYGKVYCVHKYVKGGIISLRPLGIKSSDPDIVLSVTGNGKVEICLIDNLLIVIDSHLIATVYDIGFKEESLQKIFTTHIQVPWLRLNDNDVIDDKSDCNTNCSQEFEFELEGISFHLPAIFISLDEGTARPVEINWSKVEKYMECEFTPSSYINFYQRRISRKVEMINLLHKLVDNSYEITELCNVFNIISYTYKSAVQSVRDSFSKDSTCKYIDGIKLWTVPSDVINKYIGDSSILTEGDIIMELFYKILNITSESDFNNVKDKSKAEKVLIPLLCYLRSLVSVSVAPSPCLNVLLFDICVIIGKFNMLRNFLVNGVILPSKVLRDRITKFEVQYPDETWMRQIRLDMDITMKNWNSVVRSLLDTKDYLLALDILCKNKVDDYPLYDILSVAASDVKSQEENPRLWCNLLNKVIKWKKSDNHINLEKCNMWLPMLDNNNTNK